MTLLKAAFRECRPGSLAGGTEGKADGDPGVFVCDFCAVTAGVRMDGGQFSGGGTILTAEYEEASAVFTLAVSADHPQVRPAKGEPGIWLIDPKSVRPAETKRWAPIPADLVAQVGFQRVAGWGAGWGQLEVPADVRERFNADPELKRKAAAAVRGCWPPEVGYEVSMSSFANSSQGNMTID